MLKRTLWIGAVAAVVGLFLLAGCQKQSDQTNAGQTADTTKGTAGGTAAAAPSDSAGMVKRGEYLVNFGGCNDCHSPKTMSDKGPQPDKTKLLSGHPADAKVPAAPKGLWGMSPEKLAGGTTLDMTAWTGFWGTSFAANLTPDQETGLGSWTVDMFVQTMRTGKHMGSGRDILPPMPWYDLATLTDDDLHAIFAYLHSLPPIKNQVPQPTPPAGGALGGPQGGAPKQPGGGGAH